MVADTAVEFGECPECGYLMLPVPALSPCGHEAPARRAPLTQPGEVYAWTRAWSGDAPLLMAMVDFFDGRLRVTAPAPGLESVTVGDQLRLAVDGSWPYVFVGSES